MKAAVIAAAGASPRYADFPDPTPGPGLELLTVRAAALSPLSKARSSGAHYSSAGVFPSVAGVDGVGLTTDGRRVYFAMPEAPLGALAEKTLVPAGQCVPVPDALDDVTAAAIANPGMSAWGALVERAALQPGGTVLIHGATSSAGRLATRLAKYLGAAKVIATGRNPEELQQLLSLGADILIPFRIDPSNPNGVSEYENALAPHLAQGVNIVLDYLWGDSALAILLAIAKAVEDATPICFVQIGSASGQPEISLPAAALRSSAVQLMGSGLKSIPFPRLLHAIAQIFAVAGPAGLPIDTRTLPLARIEEVWTAPQKPRIVLTIP